MKEIDKDELRIILLDLLNDVASFCDDHSILYYLSSGTLIGAIRHKGFIPWDDDIDIEMPRPDYERFVDLYRKEGKYSIISPNDKDSFYLWSKVYDSRTIKYEEGVDYKRFSPFGVDIDIFPMDGLPEKKDIISFEKAVRKRSFLFWCFKHSWCSLEGLPLKTKFVCLVCRLFGKNFFVKRYLKSSKQYSYSTSKYVGFCSPYNPYGNWNKKDLFVDRVKVQFEDFLFWAPVGYDVFLKSVYGNYLELPPVEKRVTHHKNEIYWK